MARAALAWAAATACVAAAVELPAFYTRVEDFPRRLKEVTAGCGNLASIDTTTGTTIVNINTGGSNAAAAAHAPVRGVILFGEHARELISPELGLKLVADICATAHAQAQTGGSGQPPRFAAVDAGAAGSTSASAYASVLSDLVSARAFSLKVFPLVNAWGRREVEAGNTCRRTNEHDVDLNRNYDAHWQPAPPHDPTAAMPRAMADSYPGPHPFSERETQVVRAVLDEFRPHIFLSVHSGTLGMYTPPAYSKTPHDPASPEGHRERTMAAMLARVLHMEEGTGSGTAPRFAQADLGASAGIGSEAATAGTVSAEAAAAVATAAELAASAAAAVSGATTAAAAAVAGTRRSAAPDVSSGTVPVGPAAREVGYQCPGTCLDYAFENAHSPYTFAFEIYDAQGGAGKRGAAAFRQFGLAATAPHATTHTHAHGHGHGHHHAQQEEAAASAGASASAGALDPVDAALKATLPRFRSARAGSAGGSDAAVVASAAALHPVHVASCFGGRHSIRLPEHARLEQQQAEAEAAAASLASASSSAVAAAAAQTAVLLQTQEGAAGGGARRSRTNRLHAIRKAAAAAAAPPLGASTAAAAAGGDAVASVASKLASASGLRMMAVTGTGGSTAMMTAEQCLSYFNPVTRLDYDATLDLWAARTAWLLQIAHAQVLTDHGLKA